MQTIQKRKIYYIFSGILIAASLLVLLVMGMRPGIDFTGGSLLEIRYTAERPAATDINEVLAAQEIPSVQVQAVGEQGYLLRIPYIEEEKHREIVAALREDIGDDGEQDGLVVRDVQNGGTVSELDLGVEFESDGEESLEESAQQNRLIEERFETIGPVIGQELASKSFQAVAVVLVAILIYIAWAFRKVSWPVKSWKYGSVALITLFHDIIIMIGIYTLLSHIYAWEVNTAFVAAVLTILGYSVNDTIVVFDRIRENVPRETGSFEEIVNLSVNQTLSRSLITSLTTLFVLIAVLIIGGNTIQSFVAALTVGIVVGTYSSIFIASPLLVSWQRFAKKRS